MANTEKFVDTSKIYYFYPNKITFSNYTISNYVLTLIFLTIKFAYYINYCINFTKFNATMLFYNYILNKNLLN